MTNHMTRTFHLDFVQDPRNSMENVSETAKIEFSVAMTIEIKLE